MKLENSIRSIYYNSVSNFYILLNLVFPYYHEEILNLQYKTIECMNEHVIYEFNYRKRRRFNVFIENLIQKNNELIEKIRKEEEEDNNLNNYEKVDETNDVVETGGDTSDTSQSEDAENHVYDDDESKKKED